MFNRQAKKQKAELIKRLAAYDSAIASLIGISDNSFKNMFGDFSYIVDKHHAQQEVINCLNEGLSDVGISRFNKKKSMCVLYALCLTKIAIHFNDTEFVVPIDSNLSHVKEMVLTAVFFQFLTHTTKGYAWLLTDKSLMNESWLYCKANKGAFAGLVAPLLIEGEDGSTASSASSSVDNESVADETIDADEMFTDTTANEINDFFASVEPMSEEDALNGGESEDSRENEQKINKDEENLMSEEGSDIQADDESVDILKLMNP